VVKRARSKFERSGLQSGWKDRATKEKTIIELRVEVSLFVLSPEIEGRDEVEVDNWAKHKKT
jgi:hypothetical protein